MNSGIPQLTDSTSINSNSGVISMRLDGVILAVSLSHYKSMRRSPDSLVAIATSYGLDDSGVRIPGEARDFLFSKTVQTVYEAHPVSQTVGSGVICRGRIGLGVRLTTHLHLVPRLRMTAIIPPFPLHSFLA
jgi:hypothetical protein